MTAAFLRLKVTLDGVEPKVLRRIEIPAAASGARWTNSHQYENPRPEHRMGSAEP